MTTRPTVAVFPTRNREGENLVGLLAPVVEELGLELHVYADAPNPVTFHQACLKEDVVILDASRCPPAEHNYSLMFPRPLDHLLVVSRTYLPLNVYCLREGIQDPATNKLVYGAPFYPGGLLNEDLVRWARLQLEELRPQLPRPRMGTLRTVAGGYSQALDAHDERRRKSGEVFISYRSGDNDAVLSLKQRLEGGTFQDLGRRTVRYFPPATLSDELATEQRRWQILSTTDRFMGPAAEVWIYESESYYDSWWTLGELLTLAYRGANRYRGKSGPKVKILDPASEALRDAPADYLPALSAEQNKRVARWYANSDTAQMGPESIAAIRMMAALPLVGRLKYFRDPVWSDLFWRHPILDCQSCRTLGKNRNRFNVDDVLWTRGRNFTRLPPEEAALQIERGEIACPNCGTAHNIIPGPPQYLWMPVVNGHVTAHYWQAIFGIEPDDPEERYLVALPTHRLEMRWSQEQSAPLSERWPARFQA